MKNGVANFMSEITWTHHFLADLLKLIPNNVNSLLDVGCGRGIVGALMRIYRNPKRLVAVDAFQPVLAFCLQHKLYDEYVTANLARLPLPFSNGEFDVATCVEVIEHLPKKAGVKLLDELERVANKVIVTTPEFFFHQSCFDENHFQAHLSVWTVNDFAEKGYSPYLFETIGKVWVNYPAFTSSLQGKILKLARKLFLEDCMILATKP